VGKGIRRIIYDKLVEKGIRRIIYDEVVINYLT
jgi:hypothetical protein